MGGEFSFGMKTKEGGTKVTKLVTEACKEETSLKAWNVIETGLKTLSKKFEEISENNIVKDNVYEHIQKTKGKVNWQEETEKSEDAEAEEEE